jgi:hypothetical protein
MKSPAEKLTDKHQDLTHSEDMKVASHVQRDDSNSDWIINTLMFEGVSAPFKYKRKIRYKSLQGQRVNITYYPGTEEVAGFTIEVMNIVRIRSV